MQRLEVSGAVRLIYRSSGVKGLSVPDNRPLWRRVWPHRMKLNDGERSFNITVFVALNSDDEIKK